MALRSGNNNDPRKGTSRTRRPSPASQVPSAAPRSTRSQSRRTNPSQMGSAPTNRVVSDGQRSRGRGASHASHGRKSELSFSTHKKQTLGSIKVESSHQGRNRSGGSQGKKGGSGFFGSVFGFLKSSRIFLFALILVVLIGGGYFVDQLINGKKIYSGVYVGDVELSGLTVDEAEDAIFERYAEQLQGTRILIFANEGVASQDVEEIIAQQEALAEQQSVEEARANTQVWVVTADSLAASVPAYDLATAAYQVGREDGGVFKRLKSFALDTVIEPYASFDEDSLEQLANEIDLTLGDPRVDFGMAISEGQASLVEGHDGYMVNRDTFRSKLNNLFLTDPELEVSFVAELEYAPIRISMEQAQTAVDYTNGILAKQVAFTYGEQTWDVSREELASWISTEVITERRGYKLNVLLEPSAVKPALFTNMHESLTGLKIVVQMEEKRDGIVVTTDGTAEVPQLDSAVKALDDAMFASYRSNVAINVDGSSEDASAQIADDGARCVVSIQNGLAPQEMTFEEALELGVISEISTFTTEYVNSASTQNRRHNIHLAADKISGSIVESDGGRWSFNERVGEATAEAGFLGAGAIVSGELNDAVGGGICQVATTVFNSVYESGFPVVTRHNHTLYIASYPTGRDAAIAYPYMDLIWENDSTSDVLILCSYTDSSLTVKLYGVDRGYSVKSSEGSWEDGEEYDSETIVDETLKPGTSRVETAGRNGKKISVSRTVLDSAGQVVREDTFNSVYEPVDEVIIAGPELEEEEEENESDEN